MDRVAGTTEKKLGSRSVLHTKDPMFSVGLELP